jgi:hypothetical protein
LRRLFYPQNAGGGEKDGPASVFLRAAPPQTRFTPGIDSGRLGKKKVQHEMHGNKTNFTARIAIEAQRGSGFAG